MYFAVSSLAEMEWLEDLFFCTLVLNQLSPRPSPLAFLLAVSLSPSLLLNLQLLLKCHWCCLHPTTEMVLYVAVQTPDSLRACLLEETEKVQSNSELLRIASSRHRILFTSTMAAHKSLGVLLVK